MSALTDLFQTMANKIRSKTGTATTYTPPQMVADGIDDVFDAGVASATTPITPSDSSPVAMAANTGYKPTTNGYAIANNPTSITPSNSSPVTISSGTIYKASGNGKAVETVQTITPTYGIEDTVQSGAIIRFGDSGVITKEIPTPSDLTPSNSSPATITKNGLYSATGNGYAISSYSSKTPSDTSPASVSSGAIIKASSAGYLYKTQKPHFPFMAPDKVYQGNIASSGSATISVTQKPRFIVYGVARYTSGSTASDGRSFVVMIDVTNSEVYQMVYSGSTYAYGDATYSTFVNSVSSSSVELKNPYGVTVRGHAAIYY